MNLSSMPSQLPVKSSRISKSQAINEVTTDLNILLLGETGVGKTTFINAFINHLTYNTLEEAVSGEMVVIIPAAFSITDLNTYESKVIHIGIPDKNENNIENGESKTQGCKSYVFPLGNRKLRIIDAPGIGDTRGVEQDGKNFEHILAYLSQYKHLDGICILLKPDVQRMNVLFRFCVKELLTHLHVSAKNNIMFVFTFARSSFYVPGNTAPLLKTLLKELRDKTGVDVPFTGDNTFSFDNESFRFLASCNNKVEFPYHQRQDFIKSWEVSAKEYEKLVERVVRCTPHNVRDTLSLNEAKQLIRKLHRPVAEISRLIQENIQLAERYKLERLNNATTTTTTNNLSDGHISVPQYSGEAIQLDYPRTVCTSESCTRVIDIEGVQKMDYKSHCHEHCYLRGVEQEVINNPALKVCAAMDQILEVCHQCKCSWMTHMHITYEYHTYLTSVNIPLNVNDAPRSESFSSASSSPVSDEHVTLAEIAVNELISNLKKEQTKILSICGKLSRFLRANAITPYNDDIVEYIKHFIIEEETKQKSGAENSEVIRGLETSLEAYKKERKLFEMASAAGNFPTSTSTSNIKGIVQTEDVFGLVESLYALPINGAKIRQQVESLKMNQTANVQHRERLIQLPSAASSSLIVNQLKQTLA